jgi:hypothetical protein
METIIAVVANSPDRYVGFTTERALVPRVVAASAGPGWGRAVSSVPLMIRPRILGPMGLTI